MEGKTIKLDNPEDAKKFRTSFGHRGSVEATPTAIYNALGVPENMRATFTLIPLDPISADDIRAVNRESMDYAYKWFGENGVDHKELAKELNELNKVDVKGLNETSLQDHAKLLLEKHNTWQRGMEYGDGKRDLRTVMTIVEKHVKKVNNLVYMVGEEFKSYTGEANMEALFHLHSLVLKWIDTELQRISGLSEQEIMGL